MQQTDHFLARPSKRDLPYILILIVAYLAFERISDIHEHKGLPVTAWNPGLGLLFGFMFRNLFRGCVAMFFGIALSGPIVINSALAWPATVVIAGIVTFCYGATALAAKSLLAFDTSLNRIGDIRTFLIVGLAGAALSCLLLTAALMLTGHLIADDVVPASLPLLVGDIIGIGVVTPLVLRWPTLTAGFADASVRTASLKAPACAALIGIAIWLVLRENNAIGTRYFYIFFLPVIAAALRFGLDGACMTLASVQIALVVFVSNAGITASVFTMYQSSMIVLTATALLVGAVVTEKNAAAAAARVADERLKQVESSAARADRFHLVSGMTSALSHEISQPLTAARALARSAVMRSELTTPSDAERLRENLNGVVQNIDTAGEILRRMREFLQRGEPEKTHADLRLIVADALALLRPLLDQKRVRVQATELVGDLALSCDRIQIQQIIMNLIGNAVEAITTRGIRNGQVTIGARALSDPHRIEVFVRDNGPGIARSIVDHIFEPLMTSRSEGLGLGLAVCANIVEAHSGRIWLERSKPGDTEFRFWLPAEPRGESIG
jgi:two-component system sensor kinase FixL